MIILQPHIPHYREEFFEKLSKKFSIKIFGYHSNTEDLKSFNTSSIKVYYIKSYKIGPFLWYNPFLFLKKDYSVIVLMLDFKHLSTWFLLLTKVFHKKKIILWGQGISIKRFLLDEKKTLKILEWMLRLGSGIWFYTEKENVMWKNRIPNLNSIALNNTVSDINLILNSNASNTIFKDLIKEKHGILEPIVFVYCARFTEDRRIDLLVEVIEKANPKQFGFLIIGEGDYKPSFENYPNVYDFGKVYDFSLKKELFNIADIYFQPAWLGLSIVEAMGYGKPVFSFERSSMVFQCVEYFYIQDNFNGKIFKDIQEMILYLENIQLSDVLCLGKNAKKFVKENLTMENMVNNALKII